METRSVSEGDPGLFGQSLRTIPRVPRVSRKKARQLLHPWLQLCAPHGAKISLRANFFGKLVPVGGSGNGFAFHSRMKLKSHDFSYNSAARAAVPVTGRWQVPWSQM